jgi:hypothetical protein
MYIEMKDLICIFSNNFLINHSPFPFGNVVFFLYNPALVTCMPSNIDH